ncbi:MAG: bifunctional folylpolyglutamate synthase/dihydrofolate synthase [bacterium]
MASKAKKNQCGWSYQEALSYLFGLEKIGIKFGLDNIRSLLKSLGNPEKKLKCVQVAGTNGKGSTCTFLSSILTEAGYRVGLYTSPHLVSFNERIRINGLPVSNHDLTGLIWEVKAVIDRCLESGELTAHPTYFEVATALALVHFSRSRLDLAVLECGMGGRLDATNAVKPVLSLITNIGLEHQEYLGTTLTEIAGEKAGIIKKGVAVISGIKQPEIRKLLKKICAQRKSPLLFSPDWAETAPASKSKNSQKFNVKMKGKSYASLTTRMLGDYQPDNAALALVALEKLSENGFRYTRQQLIKGLRKAFCPGRGQFLVNRQPPLFIDGAHNPEAVAQLLEILQNQFSEYELTFIIGIMKDKDVTAMLKLVAPAASDIILTRPDHPRAASAEYLYRRIPADYKNRTSMAPSIKEAIYSVDFLPYKCRLVCITGSLYLVGETYRYLGLKPF